MIFIQRYYYYNIYYMQVYKISNTLRYEDAST